ncbi:WD repeat-containing protein 18-like [Gigantopelta aegis]|uniref:WD repeat-containing protein 18-like n=1 Tax=Gigantopelta aegis TaxID=1735272 RepID=UPI001B888975|nr:WD repeat-containing protein 18-like [Gigantopelta aegis]
MSAPYEILMTSDASGHLWNACVWDIQTGASLLTYRGGSTGPRTLCVLGGDYLIGADSNKPLLHLWSLQKKDQTQMRIVCPGRVTSLAVSPDGSYCVAGIAEKLHVWQVCSGNLLAVVSRHYQNINVIKFTDDGSHFISAAADNLIIVWSLTSVVSLSAYSTGQSDPRHVWSSHSLPITDLHVGAGGVRARVISSSLDHTCKLWDIASGSLLCTFVFDVGISSITMDMAEFRIFAGGTNGNIFAVNMYGQPMKTERHISSTELEESGVTCFKGHEKQVTQLSVSLDGTRLVSGSHDCTCRLWDIFSGQCLRTLVHKGIVTNAFFMLTPQGIANPDKPPMLPIQQFKRSLHMSSEADKNTTETLDVRLQDNTNGADKLYRKPRDNSVTDILQEEARLDLLQQNTKTLSNEVAMLKAKNKQMYEFCVEHILNSKVK